MTITDFCDEINNYFVSDRRFGTFTIENGALTGADDFLRENQYFRIVNAVFNEGVYKYPTDELTDETFEGAIWAMAVPPAALALLEKIQEWDSQYGNNADNYTPYASETMHHYSRSFAVYTNSKGELVRPTWQAVFRKELNRWRKI
jgi:hypothetical protein